MKKKNLLLATILLLIASCTMPTLVNAQDTIVFATPGAYAWTAPNGVTSVNVLLWGGGGAGAGTTNNSQAGSGGGGGAFVSGTFSVTPGNTYNYYVGNGGTGVAGGNGNHGESSWFFSNTTLLAVGGEGGAVGSVGVSGYGEGGSNFDCIPPYGYSSFGGGYGAYSQDPLQGGGGGGGEGSNGAGTSAFTIGEGGGYGNVGWQGGAGGAGAPGTTGPLYLGQGGNGADGAFGVTGGTVVIQNGNPGSAPGGGGSGGVDANDAGNTTVTGGAGANGQAMLVYIQTFTWTGSDFTTEWEDAGNWDIGSGWPGQYTGDAALINAAGEGGDYPVITAEDGTVSLQTITVGGAGNIVTLAANSYLDVDGTGPVGVSGSFTGIQTPLGGTIIADPTSTIEFANATGSGSPGYQDVHYGYQQVIDTGFTYGNLVLSSGGVAASYYPYDHFGKIIPGTINIAGNLIISAAVTLLTNTGDYPNNHHNYNINVGGNLTVGSGGQIANDSRTPIVMNSNGSTVTANSSTIGALSATANISVNSTNTTISYLTVNSTATGSAITLGNGNLTVDTLTFQHGNIATGVYGVIIPVNGVSISGASSSTGWVNGALQRNFPTNTGTTTFKYEIGDANTYAPATLAINNVNGSVNIAGLVATADADESYVSGIDPIDKADHYWFLAKSGAGSFSNYNATFDFTNCSYSGTIANYIARKFDPSAWVNTTSSATGNTVTATGLTSIGAPMSDFEVGVPVIIQSTSMGGNWIDNGTWTNDATPYYSDNAHISTGSVVTVTTSTSIIDLTIDANAVLYINAGVTLVVHGDQNFQNSQVQGPGTLVIGSSPPQIITGSSGTEVNNVIINNASHVTLDNFDLVLNGTLSFSQGNIITGASKVIMKNYNETVTASATTGWVNGTLQKNSLPASGDATATFEVGDSTRYAPMQVDLHGLSGTSGAFAAQTVAGNHPGIANSLINPAKCVQRYYSLSNNGATFNNYDLTLNFNAADVPAGADTSKFVVAQTENHGATWTLHSSNITHLTTAIKAGGFGANSEFIVGEVDCSAELQIPAISGSLALCSGSSSILSTGSYSSYLWSTGETTSSINVSTAGSFSVTITDANGCTGTSSSVTTTVSPLPTINAISNQTLCTGSSTTAVNFSGTANVYNWTNSSTSIGLAASGTGNIASFTATNSGTSPVTATITATPVSSGFAYVANAGSNTVSVINTATNAVTATITVGSYPVGVSVSPDGSRVYVTNYGNGTESGTVSIINTATNTVVNTVTVGTGPWGISVSPDGSTVYVVNQASSTISVINTSDNIVSATITGLNGPAGIAVSPDGSRLYVTSVNSNNVSVINTATNAVTTTITVGSFPEGVSISPDGSKVYIANEQSGNVSVIDTSTNTVTSTITVGSYPFGISVSPDGSMVYVTNNAGISVINTATNTVVATITGLGNPNGISVSPDGSTVYVCNNGGSTVSIINTTSNTVTNTVTVGSQPFSFGNFVTGINCSGTPITFNITVNPLPTPVISGTLAFCSGSSTTLSTGLYSSYSWSTGATTQSISVSTAGTFSVSVTDGNGCIGTSSSVTTVVNPLPTPAITGTLALCSGSSSILSTGSYSSYLWSTGETTSSINVSTAGTFSVTVTDGNGCVGKSSSVTTIVNTLPTLVHSEVKQLWGMTSAGGQSGAGVIFNTDSSGNNETVQQSFFQIEGAFPALTNLIQVGDGNLYGMTQQGGVNGLGVLFQYNPATSTYTDKFDFNGTANGSEPDGSLIQASDGNLYGMTHAGGANDAGVIFKYNPAAATCTDVYDFPGGYYGNDPQGSLMQASDGNLYGMTSGGGADGYGVLFQYNPATTTYTKKFDFDGSTSGDTPFGSLIQASDGNLYGMTDGGGTNNDGVLFQYNPATNVYTKKLDFAGATNGENPVGSLMQASDGNLYGMTYYGGTNNEGVLFQYNPGTSAFAKKLDFSNSAGINPFGSLMQASDGNLYGMTNGGGANGDGVLFQYNTGSSVYTDKIDFAGTTNGSLPQGSLMQASDGNLYGMTLEGGANGDGVLFQYNPSTSTYTKKLDFGVAANGSNPGGTLMQASDGTLYGMTEYGGANNEGVLFQYNPATAGYTKKLDFVDSTSGSNPIGSLIQASDGNLYGMTLYGGVYGDGNLFQYNPATSTLTDKVDFADLTNGQQPYGSLMQASDGNLYGMTALGGVNEEGILFQYNPATSTFTKKLDFDGANGSGPEGSLMQASDGYLYGMTGDGGANGNGVLFQYNPATSTFTDKFDFNGTNGSGPEGSLIQASDGNLYGMTTFGGDNSDGVLFQYNPATSTYTKKLDFAGTTNGKYPAGSLMQASDGNLYGMTQDGGTNDDGVFFQYNPATSTFTKKLDFNGTNGENPVYNNLIEIASVLTASSNSPLCSGNTLNLASSGGTSYSWTGPNSFTSTVQHPIITNATIAASGTYSVTITNSNGCTASDTTTVIVYPMPTPAISGTLTFCSGNSTTLSAGSYSSYSWSTGATTSSINVSTAGTYTVAVSNSSGCTGTSSSVTINVNSLPTPAISGTLAFCSGSSTVLSAGSYSSYLWSTSATTSSINVSTAGTFSVTVTDGNGCTGVSSSVITTVSPTPTINSVSNQTLCSGSSTTAVNFSGTANVYNWTNSSTSIGLAASGTGNIASFTATNSSTSPVTATITATPVSSGFAYITNFHPSSNSVSVINTATNTVIATIAVGANPTGISVSPDGSRVYIANTGSNYVSVINTTTNAVITTIDVGGEGQGIVVSPDGSKVYVVYPNQLVVINTSDNTVLTTIGSLGFDGATGIAVSPDGSRIYVTNGGNNSGFVSVINAATYTLITTIPVGTVPQDIAVSPEGKWLYITNNIDHTLSVINTTDYSTTATISVGTNPIGVSVSPDGSKVYVANAGSGGTSGSGPDASVIVISAATNTITATISLPNQLPYGISVSPDGSTVYVADYAADDVSVINAATNTVTSTVAVGVEPKALGNFVTGINCSGTPVTFNITVNPNSINSTSVTICNSYAWNGTTYISSGTYTYDAGNNAAGCDSVATLYLTINHSNSSIQNITACNSYVWLGNTYTANYTALDAFTNAFGCDSAVTLNLTINYSSTSSTSVTNCDSYAWNGTTYTTGGTYTFDAGATSNASECDSVATLNLTIYHSSTSSTSVTSCDKYVWYGSTYTFSFSYNHNLGNVNSQGCDSLITLHLTINHSDGSSTAVTNCNNYVWNGTTYTASNIFKFSAPGASTWTAPTGITSVTVQCWGGGGSGAGSDIVNTNGGGGGGGAYTYNTISVTPGNTYNLYVGAGGASADTTGISGGSSWFGSATTILAVGGAGGGEGVTGITGMGGSAALCIPAVNSHSGGNGGKSNNSTTSGGGGGSGGSGGAGGNAGTYLGGLGGVGGVTGPGGAGASGVSGPGITQNGTAGSVPGGGGSGAINASGTTVTGGAGANGQVWIFSPLTYNFTNATGCDSLTTLFLTINNSSTSNSSVTNCNSYVWNGSTYAFSSTYSYDAGINSNAAGCDSVAYLNLTINPLPVATASSNSPVAWGNTLNLISGGGTSYSWSGPAGFTSTEQNPSIPNAAVNMSGTYSVSVTDVNGCNSSTSTNVIILGPLDGIYIIGGTLPDYVDLTTAINDLNARGISGNVTFNIRAGTYISGQTINAIRGANSSDTVSFQSESDNDAEDTIISTGQYAITLANAQNVLFNNLTFSNINYGILSYTNCSGLQVTHCNFNNINYPVYLSDTNSFSTGDAYIVISDDSINSAINGIYASNYQRIKVLRNLVTCNLSSSYSASGISLNNVPSFDIERNKISTVNSGSATGIYIARCSGSSVSHNKLINNFVEIGGGSPSSGVIFQSSSGVNVYHNTIKIVNTDSVSSAFNTFNLGNLYSKNNIFINTGGGLAVNVAAGDFFTSSMDYNDYFVTGYNVAQWSDGLISNLSAWQRATNKDAHTISTDPQFNSPADSVYNATSLALYHTGTPVGVTVDIDGNARSAATNPDMGAALVTVTTQSDTIPLCGTYTIGAAAASNNFATLDDAIAALTSNGISCDVIFNISTGSYNGAFHQSTINGLSNYNITFESASGNADSVTISGSFSLSKNMLFRNLTLTAIAGGDTAISISGVGNINVTIDHCKFNGVPNGIASYGIQGNMNCSGLQVINCTFTNVYYPIFLTGGIYSDLDSAIIISSNAIAGAALGVKVQALESVQILSNQISGDSLTYGIYVNNVAFYHAEKNQISSTYSIVRGMQAGVYINNSAADSASHSTIINNFISVSGSGGTDSLYGIYIANTAYLDIYHNSVNITAANSNNSAYIDSGGISNVNNKNNIFANSGGGYAVEDESGTATYSNNDYYFTGLNIGNYEGADMTNLSGWIFNTAENGSISVNPMFTSVSDLHVSNDSLSHAGTWVGVVDDIDGALRNGNPSIGAVELNSCRLVASISTIPTMCPDSDGQAHVFTNGGAEPLTYLWSNSQTDTIATGLMPGVISVTVTDASGCIDSATQIVAAGSNWHAQNAIGNPGDLYTLSFSFSVNGKGYYGVYPAGDNWPSADPTSLWEYDPSSSHWTQRASFPGYRTVSPSSFGIETTGNGPKGYVCVGMTAYNSFTNEVWEYTPPDGNGGGDSWQQLNPFPGTGRYAASGFSIAGTINRGYLAAGYDGTNKEDVWEYNPDADQWTQKDNWPGLGSLYAASFSVGDKAYMGIGLNRGISHDSYNKDFYEFDPTRSIGRQWHKLHNFAGGYRAGTVNFGIGGIVNKGYVMLGTSGYPAAQHIFSDAWEYAPPDGNGGGDSWAQQHEFSGQRGNGNGNGIAIGTVGYIYIADSAAMINEFYKFNTGNQSTDSGGLWMDACTWIADATPATNELARISTTNGRMVTVTTNTMATSIAVDSGALVNVMSDDTLNIAGDVNLNGNMQGDGSITFSGDSLQTISGKGGVFSNLTVNNPNGVILDPTSIYVTNSLTFNSTGNLIAQSNETQQTYLDSTVSQVVMPYTCMVAASPSTGWVEGTLLKNNLPNHDSATVTFEIGDKTTYDPVTVDLHGLSGSSGGFYASTAKIVGNNYPGSSNSPIDVSNSVPRFWTVSDTGTHFASFDLTLEYDPSEVTVDPSQFVVFRYESSNSAWTIYTDGITYGHLYDGDITKVAFMAYNSVFMVGKVNCNNVNPILTPSIVSYINGGSSVSKIKLNTSGNYGPYTYHWSNWTSGFNITASGDTSIIDSLLTQGTYTVTVIAAGGCVSTKSVTVNPPAILNLKMFIQGYYLNLGTSTPMDNFGGGGCLYASGASSIQAEVDTITISLMDPNTHGQVGPSVKGILHTDGSVWQNGNNFVILPGSVAGNNYYIKVNHRNAIETWSGNAVLFSLGTTYDFSTALGQAYGNNMALVDKRNGNNIYALWNGDVYDANNNIPYAQDGVIESSDYGLIEEDYTAILFGYYPTDVTGDGVVESADYSLVEENYTVIIFAATPW